MKNNEMKTKLLEEKSALEAQLHEIASLVDPELGTWEAMPEAGESEADPNDLADRNEEFESRSNRVETLVARWKDVTTALNKIEDGTYGKCKICNKDIEADRLEANPAALTCKEHINEG